MNRIKLNEIQVDEICKLAEEKRRILGFAGEIPIANDIFTILDRLDIVLLELSIESEDNKPAFSAAIMYSEERDEEVAFIGLNTADYYDKQIFAIAHELYHYYTKSGTHLSRPEDEEYSLIETLANRFAAEFLLPESVLKRIVLEEFSKSSLDKIQYKTILRFIAWLHCTWWLPYRSLVRRLREIEAISSKQYTELYSIDERNLRGEYGKIGQAIDKDVFLKLNRPTKTIGTSFKEIETIIRNFEDNLIDEDKFTKTLNLFNREPGEFGYEIKVSKDDLDELDAFFGGEDVDED